MTVVFRSADHARWLRRQQASAELLGPFAAEPFGDDLGYGPARLFRPEAVQAIHATLAALSDNQVWSRFDPERMTEHGIYPVIWDEPEAELRQEYLGYLAELHKVVETASKNAGGLVLIIE
jgi:hypothetical protein